MPRLRLAFWVLGLALARAAGAQDVLETRTTRVEFDPGRRAFALMALSECPSAVDRVRATLGLETPEPRTLRIVADQRELDERVREAVGADAPDWAGAIAVPARKLVFLRADMPRRDDVAVRAILAHEFAHLAIQKALEERGRATRPIPRWIEEGFAQIAAGRLRLDEDVDLRPAAFFGRLLEPADLDAAFRGGEGAAAKAYAEAEAFLRFLARRHGTSTTTRLLRALLDGVPLKDAVTPFGGQPFDAEWELFRAHLKGDRSWMVAFAGQALLAGFFVFVAVFAGLRRRAKRAAAFARYEAEDLAAASAVAVAMPADGAEGRERPGGADEESSTVRGPTNN